MYYYIKGKATVCEPNLVVVESGGVGYAVNTSFFSSSAVKTGDEVMFYTHLHLAEGIMKLYGFKTKNELTCFKQLIGVSGVGPRIAAAILSVVTPEKLVACIATDDETPLCAASGVGKKMAQKIILELRDKIDLDAGDAGGYAAAGGAVQGEDMALSDATAALIGLGYPRAQVLSTLQGVKTTGMAAEEIIRLALKRLLVQ